MTEPANSEESTVVPMVSRAGRLADALERARERQQAEARRVLQEREGRMAVLARELDAMANELPDGEAGRFEMIVSHRGDRLVVDPLSYVDLDETSHDYRLIRQRRDGEETILQSADSEEMADGVAAYVADRILEREGVVPPTPAAAPKAVEPAPIIRQGFGFWGGFWLFVLGGVCTATVLFAYAWQTYTPS